MDYILVEGSSGKASMIPHEDDIKWCRRNDAIMKCLRWAGIPKLSNEVHPWRGKPHRQDSSSNLLKQATFQSTWEDCFIVASQVLREDDG